MRVRFGISPELVFGVLGPSYLLVRNIRRRSVDVTRAKSHMQKRLWEEGTIHTADMRCKLTM